MIAAIIDQRPDFVFNNLIGTSAYAFFRAFRAACRARGIDQAVEIPVASCTLSEPELPEIGPGRGRRPPVLERLLLLAQFPGECIRSSAPIPTCFPDGPVSSADAESSYVSVKLLAAAAW